MVYIVKDVGNRDISPFCWTLGREELSVCVWKQIHMDKQSRMRMRPKTGRWRKPVREGYLSPKGLSLSDGWIKCHIQDTQHRIGPGNLKRLEICQNGLSLFLVTFAFKYVTMKGQFFSSSGLYFIIKKDALEIP